MIPDPEARGAFLRDLPRTPFDFLEAVAPAGAEWEALPRGYLQFSRAYDGACARAQAMGWPVRRERLHHLAMLSEPARVAEMLQDLVRDLGL